MFEYFLLLFEVASSPLSSAQTTYNIYIFFSFLSNDDLENVAPSFDAKDLSGFFVLGDL
jgi:hypothetical protein